MAVDYGLLLRLKLRLTPKPVTALGLGSRPKLTQIAEALVYVGG
jgi:hypothetical protein